MVHIKMVRKHPSSSQNYLLSFQNPLSNTYLLVQAVFFQMFLYCFAGEMVVSKATEANNALYCSQWYNVQSIKMRRTLLLMIVGTQARFGFSVGGFQDLSLALYAQVVKSTYSFYAFITNTMG